MEKELIEGVVTGSYKSFSLLYDMWGAHLFRFVFSLVKSEAIAEDIVQETFVKVWTNRAGLRSDLSFKSYLFTISYHMVLKEFRRTLNHSSMEDYLEYCNTLSLSEASVEQGMDFDTFLIELNRAKTKLTPRQCQIFEMNKEYNYSVSEIAERLSLTEQSVRNQLSTALKIVRSELGDYAFLLLLFYHF
ncbi:RNA polymerase sigma factor [Phocaeicola sp.]